MLISKEIDRVLTMTSLVVASIAFGVVVTQWAKPAAMPQSSGITAEKLEVVNELYAACKESRRISITISDSGPNQISASCSEDVRWQPKGFTGGGSAALKKLKGED